MGPLLFLSRYPHLPCLQVGRKRDCYLPMEVCTTIPCQKRNLSEQQISNMIRSTAHPAPERQKDNQLWVDDWLLFLLLIKLSSKTIYLSVYLSVCLSVSPSTFLSVFLVICLSTYQLIFLSIYRSLGVSGVLRNTFVGGDILTI